MGAKHENFSLNYKETIHQVRETRITPGLEAQVVINNITFILKDLATHGLAVYAPSDTSFEIEKEYRATLNYGDLHFDDFEIKCMRLSKQGSTFEFGFEVTDFSFNLDLFRSCDMAYGIMLLFDKEINPKEVDAKFRDTVLKLRSELSFLKTYVDSFDFVEEAEKFTSREVSLVASFETVFSEQLKSTFISKMKELEEITLEYDKNSRKAAYSFFRTVMGDIIFDSPFISRVYHKPLGYAGDFEMMNHIYENSFIGKSLFARCFNNGILGIAASNAVRNRIEYLSEQITNYSNLGAKKFLSVACGPAKEVQSLLSSKDSILNGKEVSFLDQDLSALQQTKVHIKTLMKANEINLDVNFLNLAIRDVIEGELHNKYDMIYSAGLFDYFSDTVAIIAAKSLYKLLSPGGVLIIGNFNADNPSRFIMECVGDWILIHRSKEELKEMFSFADRIEIDQESEGVNLFAKLIKDK